MHNDDLLYVGREAVGCQQRGFILRLPVTVSHRYGYRTSMCERQTQYYMNDEISSEMPD